MKIAGVISISLLWAAAGSGQQIAGLWDATVKVSGNEIPFRMEFSGTGDKVRGNFFNGEERVPSSGGTLRAGELRLNFDSYANRLEATVTKDAIDGRYGREGRWYEFHAKPAAKVAASAVGVPDIAGLWEIPTKSSKGESAWRLIVQQKGAEVSAAILRVDGDTGALTGTWRDGRLVLSHFSGARPNLLEVTRASDGSLKLLQNGKTTLTAIRPAAARAQGLAEPTDPFRHTGVKDPATPLSFAFPDLDGRVVSLDDPRFQGKVVLVAISGSWCPNCHDEAPFLEELYRKYRAQGLEIVALSIEEAEPLKTLARLRAFVKEYEIDYTVLAPGEPAELAEKFPRGDNLKSWPTTYFLGRDHRVRGVHAGFAGRVSGDFHSQTRDEITGIIERLLAEKTTSAASRDR